jgi:hypothetical protein
MHLFKYPLNRGFYQFPNHLKMDTPLMHNSDTAPFVWNLDNPNLVELDIEAYAKHPEFCATTIA